MLFAGKLGFCFLRVLHGFLLVFPFVFGSIMNRAFVFYGTHTFIEKFVVYRINQISGQSSKVFSVGRMFIIGIKERYVL